MEKYEELIEILNTDKRVLNAEKMNDEHKKEILQLEMKRLDEVIPLINKALKDALECDNAIMVVRDRTGITLNPEDIIPTLTLENESGVILGEEIYDPEELEELKDDPDVYFMSDNFVNYTNLSMPGVKEFFVVSELFNEFDCEDQLNDKVEKLIIAEPSTDADKYIKDYFKIESDESEELASLIVGFD